MLVIPAIDIIDGKVVRLSKGEYDSVISYNKTPLEQAKIYDSLGFEWLHVVDLSGSKDGSINTTKIIEDIKNQTNLKIEFGGGIRTQNDVVKLNDLGVDGIIIGSMSVTNKTEFESIFELINPDKIIIAADVLDYTIRIKGWTEDSNIHLFDHIEYCKGLGIKNYLCTDIAVDGMLTGPSYTLYNETIKKYPEIELTASGGVSSMNDIIRLLELPLRGVVVGKAIYENKINLEELAKIAL
ncbi:MAG: 1-(5-phosphoribosyl)-5-[(5-phosphoribosylamino)methylideneamino]imidazole-4-carboxamide isomerase [Melioribacteraceae bacterium]|nr:1-(5-phosphoribosyl)-5-[(5-phosphoribosylamino)methylideneamino]imidazole-4-carboxamide isomerase [Melioribacteraceae bacterium]